MQRLHPPPQHALGPPAGDGEGDAAGPPVEDDDNATSYLDDRVLVEESIGSLEQALATTANFDAAIGACINAGKSLKAAVGLQARWEVRRIEEAGSIPVRCAQLRS